MKNARFPPPPRDWLKFKLNWSDNRTITEEFGGRCRPRRWRSAGRHKVKISTTRTRQTRRQIMKLKIRVGVMQDGKARIRSKYPQACRQDIFSKRQPVHRLIFTPAVRKEQKNHTFATRATGSTYVLVCKTGRHTYNTFYPSEGRHFPVFTGWTRLTRAQYRRLTCCGNMHVRTIRKTGSAF